MNEIYHSIHSSVTAQIKVEGSRFIANAVPVVTEAEADEHLEGIRKKYFDATHHCFAYVIGAERSIVRYSDDGEPSRTAGVKIYSAIQSKNLSDILVTVTRYFGGTKLGVGGLGRAYYEAAFHGIESADIITKAAMTIIEIRFGFNDTNAVMNTIHSAKYKIIDTQYSDTKSILRLLVPQLNTDKFISILTDATHARAEISTAGRQIVTI
ncbi:MAG: YigZ family protein [Ignavibacteriales bacterium]|nr:YigZ family protein [Ignavibacteriales bacterium]